MGWGEEHTTPATKPSDGARKILVAFALKQGLDEVHADLAVSEVLSRRVCEPVTVTSALAVLNEIVQCAENGRHVSEPTT